MKPERHKIVRCPVCSDALVIAEKTAACAQGHCFDRARSGYINLNLDKAGKTPSRGDSKDQIRRREAFLSQRVYSPLLSRIFELSTNEGRSSHVSILDVGAGSGYYLRQLGVMMETSGFSTTRVGFDLSKDSADFSARADKGALFVVATARSTWPIHDNSCDVVLNLFSPHNFGESARVVAPSGVLILAFSGENHLVELRAKYGLIGVEEQKYERYRAACTEHFEKVERSDIRYRVTLSSASCRDLVLMGPNAVHFPGIDFESQDMDLTIEFGLIVGSEPKI